MVAIRKRRLLSSKSGRRRVNVDVHKNSSKTLVMFCQIYGIKWYMVSHVGTAQYFRKCILVC